MSADLLLSPILLAIFYGTLRIFTRKKWVNWIEVLSIGFLTAYVLYSQHFTTFVVGGWSSAIGVELKYDSNSFWFILSLLVVWGSVKIRFEKWDQVMESLADYLFATLYALFISNDLFNIYVTIELASVVSFLMIGHGDKPSRIWAALKYMFLSSIAFGFYLFGTVLIYYENGVISIGALQNEKLSAFALTFIVVALLVKSGIFGLSAWMIDVYSMADTPVSMLLSGTTVNAGLFAIVRIYPLLPEKLKEFVMGVGIFSACAGAIYAIFDDKVKRTLAFSTTSQMGVAVSLLSLSPTATSLYAFAHSNAKALLFSKNGRISTLIGSLSLIGLPPLAGYFAKVYFEKSFPLLSSFLLFLTSIYVVKLFKNLKWRFSPFELLLESALFSFIFFKPFGNAFSVSKVLVIASVGILVGIFFEKKISLPHLKDVFGLEEGIAYQLWALVVMLIVII